MPLAAAIALLLFLLGGCGGGGDRHESGSAATLDDAYVYCYPLVMMSVSQKVATNVVEATSEKVPVNQLRHAQRLAGPDFKDVVTPNVDTLYSQAFIDLKGGPLVFVKPAADRYCSAQFLDAWTNSVGIAGTVGREGTSGEQVCLLMRSDDKTIVPAGMTQIGRAHV